MKYLPKVPDDAYVKVETTKILKQYKAYMAQFEEMLTCTTVPVLKQRK